MQITDIIKSYKWRFSLVSLLIILEAALALLFPLFIGRAIDEAIQKSYQGALLLFLLGAVSLVIGAARRYFDTRFYARVFQEHGASIISKHDADQASVKTARLGMIKEVIEFLEFYLPEIISSLIGIVGVIVIIASLNSQVFLLCLAVSLLIAILYRVSKGRTLRYNQGYNDEIEKQVDIIADNKEQSLNQHLSRMMQWNIRLSDLETVNFSISWLILILFLSLSIIVSVQTDPVQYGTVFALIMYVFQYMESVVNLPVFYQNWLRLQEIKQRLAEV